MIRFLEWNLGINLCDLGLDNDFIDMTPKQQTRKEKKDL